MRSFHIHGTNSRSAFLDIPIKAHSIPAGKPHTISVGFAAQFSKFSSDELYERVKAGPVFCQIEWTLSDIVVPKFVTRHKLVEDQTFDIALSDGFGWALDAYKRIHGHKPEDSTGLGGKIGIAPSLIPQDQNSSASHASTQPRGATPSRKSNLSGSLPDASSGACPRDADDLLSPDEDEDQPVSPGSPASDSVGSFTPDQDSDIEDQAEFTDEQVQGQILREMLEERWRDAQELYRKTGDTSACFAVLDMASEYGNLWHASGSPRFWSARTSACQNLLPKLCTG